MIPHVLTQHRLGRDLVLVEGVGPGFDADVPAERRVEGVYDVPGGVNESFWSASAQITTAEAMTGSNSLIRTFGAVHRRSI